MKLSLSKIAGLLCSTFILLLSVVWVLAIFTLDVDLYELLGLLIFGLPLTSLALYFFYKYRRNFPLARWKFFFIYEPGEEEAEAASNKKIADRYNQRVKEAELKALERKKSLMKKERNRKNIEKFKIKYLNGGFKIIPVLLSFCIGIYILYKLVTQDYKFDLTMFLLVLMTLSPLFEIFITENWEEKVSLKEELKNKQKFPLSKYDLDYLYFDSAIYYWSYLLLKIYAILLNILILGGLSFMFLYWVSNIYIAPTTVIIILLLIIIYNQSNKS